MIDIRLVTGLLERDGALLLVASQYPNLPQPLWHLPGGRPRGNELSAQALEREFLEETGLAVTVGELLYASESFDPTGDARILNLTFAVRGEGEARSPQGDAHVVDIAWVTRDQALQRIAVNVIREPLAAHFRGETHRYQAFPDAGITIRFADDP